MRQQQQRSLGNSQPGIIVNNQSVIMGSELINANLI